MSRDAIVAEAHRWIGTPYRHQASLRGVGCDCLGLLRGVWREVMVQELDALVSLCYNIGPAGFARTRWRAASTPATDRVRPKPF